MIDRSVYLTLCRECAMLDKRGMYGIRLNVPDRLRVMWQGREYYPQAYELAFYDDGTVRHTAVIHALTANSISHVPLEDITAKGGNDDG